MNHDMISSSQVYGFLPVEIEGVDALAALALDMRWSWNHEADKLWQRLDPLLWELTHNPWIVLQTVAYDQLERQMANPEFRGMLDDLIKTKQTKLSSPAWFQENHADAPLTCVAYFSMEFMLSEALPIYVGGLGNVAGDQLKSASDLGVPVAAVGLFYQQGYFRQQIDKYGNQQALFPYNDPGQLPVTPLRLPNGEWLRIKVSLSGYPVWFRTWQVRAGRVKLYLLDSNDPVNLPVHRGITSEIYGGGPDQRIQQEILLGIGGWKLLNALGIKPEVCHMNEGHAAFLVLERANDFMKENGTTFEEALAVTRAGNLFTTHTAVAAGFDHFSPSLMEQFFGDYAVNELGINFNNLMALGRQDPNNTSESFNTAYLAIRGCGAVNGVSELHGAVSRRLFQSLFPRWPVEEVPVGVVTNGVHTPSWDSEFADELWTEASGKSRWRGELKTLEENINTIPNQKLWDFRNASRNRLVNYVRKRLERQLMLFPQTQEMIDATKSVFDPNTLTLGFARRFVSYKRPNLLLHDEERLIRILTNQERPVQLVIAGKAPPFDEPGKALIKQWIQFIQQHNLYKRVVFLSDYDMLLTENLVQGVDVWINTPRRPWEACGTSGMKVLVNGGVNLSELDGWWAEAYTPEVGWALGDVQEHGDDPGWDAVEAGNLYDLLEQQVVPGFYSRDGHGIPVKWIEKMRKSMATLTPRFSANRVVREYTEKYYLPAAANYKKRAEDKGTWAKKIMHDMNDIKNKWQQIYFGETTIGNVEGGYEFKIFIGLNGIHPEQVAVELFAEGMNGAGPEIIKMEPGTNQKEGNYWYHVIIKTKRKAADYTIRIKPCYEGISAPLEDNRILWQR
ncbi:alpha-glucan family phosphorylase [Agriterribacter sp.]|uniref:alpha-glucan family phosphorylase n=1 Tax=Agriterribacter sp. TaxID=2821509 RepID=UPI002CBB40D3|nr:alpha-glucan family phosphorylase [Agriterribacter sp.]HTN05488.1 alpha-glucan family phosphorylase [Agriterribacter sp.]